MKNEKLLIEKLSEIEHRQWESWSKYLWNELKYIKSVLESKNNKLAVSLLDSRYQRWKKYWVPYSELDEETKDKDRVWAEEVLSILKKHL